MNEKIKKESVYLHDIPLEDARKAFADALQKEGLWGLLGVEEIPLDENACGRILAEPVFALRSSPHYHASAMDGYALSSSDTEGAMSSSPVEIQVGEQAKYVDTGDPIPEGANAVIPIENVEPLDDAGNVCTGEEIRKAKRIRIRASVAPWSHVRPMGEDIVATQLILPSGQKLRPVDLGAAAAGGNCALRVAKKPMVTILPTGTELVKVGESAGCGEITEFNSIVLAAQVKGWGGQTQRYGITRDDFKLICAHIQDAADHSDLVLINAGSSAGSEDFTSRAVEQLGTLLVHGIAVRPGHPVVLGMIVKRNGENAGRKVPIIGVPGYPVSAAMTTEIFVEPLLRMWAGEQITAPQTLQAEITRKVSSPAGDDDYLRVVVGEVNSRMLAAPLSRGAGVTTSLSRADGIVIIPRHSQGLEAGERVEVKLYRPLHEIEGTIFTIGSHDMTLDILAQSIAGYGRRLVSSNAGSMGGLIAISKGEAHFAGSHLLDPADGDYNRSYIKKYLPGIPIRLFNWVEREQGLLVKKGNPKKIKDLSDLARRDVTYVNRQRGSGTRVLLDYWLGRLGIRPEQIQGYPQEEYTHLGVAAAVLSGRADCGMAVQAAAAALDLDFIPLYAENYQLVIPAQYCEADLLEPLFRLMHDPHFKQQIMTMPGYKVDHMGEEVPL